MRPLNGITVVTLEHAIAAPFATRQLADLGARVIKIERPGVGDFARGYDARVRGLASHFVWTNRSKESLTLDIKHPEARQILKRLIREHADVGAATPWFADDLAMLRVLHGVGAMVPKAEARAVLTDVLAALGEEPVLVPLIESALGLRAIDIIAGTVGVQRLAFGTLDFALDLGLSEDQRGLLMPASQIALASRCAGLAAPIAGVTAAIHDHDALVNDIAFARALGFAAKLCIHPRQVSIVQGGFRAWCR